ncbi:MAG: GNAT family N-acetyltransferase [Oscillospiraceae bacterium]|nr:GNAT family N-acetyltransferase [Oscillospiraceae bacterium]
MLEGGDMIVSLYNLPEIKVNGNIKIKRAFVGDKDIILDFVGKYFRKNWVYEVEHSLMEEVSKCFVATEDGKIIGFACYDSSAKGFFGPIGVEPTRRGENIGQALLVRTLSSMKEYGYGYAIIGWVSEAEMFYRKTVGAEFIKGGSPENSVYSNLVFM